MVESQLWLGVKGMVGVGEIVAPTTIRVPVTEPNPHAITVKLIGIRAPANKRAAKDAISFLRRTVEGREVEALLTLVTSTSGAGQPGVWRDGSVASPLR